MNERMLTPRPLIDERWHGASAWPAPAWLLRWRLRSVRHAIAHLEHQLAGEFALLETEPLHRELRGLSAESDRLNRRLADRSR